MGHGFGCLLPEEYCLQNAKIAFQILKWNRMPKWNKMPKFEILTVYLPAMAKWCAMPGGKQFFGRAPHFLKFQTTTQNVAENLCYKTAYLK